MGYSKTFLVLGLVFAVVLFISSHVSARQIVEAAQTQENLQTQAVEEANHYDQLHHRHGHHHHHHHDHHHGVWTPWTPWTWRGSPWPWAWSSPRPWSWSWSSPRPWTRCCW
ncbi:uncharacterized protein LOC132173297 [Corylus avellana]|uniref:uncharacterized protein LOC132173297 n=1 Tax=Corylus avellana TaxID=13451 RepID=UPI00286B176B|nr:uncharacterized protein LOC132173297 [Corylus avellana]